MMRALEKDTYTMEENNASGAEPQRREIPLIPPPTSGLPITGMCHYPACSRTATLLPFCYIHSFLRIPRKCAHVGCHQGVQDLETFCASHVPAAGQPIDEFIRRLALKRSVSPAGELAEAFERMGTRGYTKETQQAVKLAAKELAVKKAAERKEELSSIVAAVSAPPKKKRKKVSAAERIAARLEKALEKKNVTQEDTQVAQGAFEERLAQVLHDKTGTPNPKHAVVVHVAGTGTPEEIALDETDYLLSPAMSGMKFIQEDGSAHLAHNLPSPLDARDNEQMALIGTGSAREFFDSEESNNMSFDDVVLHANGILSSSKVEVETTSAKEEPSDTRAINETDTVEPAAEDVETATDSAENESTAVDTHDNEQSDGNEQVELETVVVEDEPAKPETSINSGKATHEELPGEEPPGDKSETEEAKEPSDTAKETAEDASTHVTSVVSAYQRAASPLTAFIRAFSQGARALTASAKATALSTENNLPVERNTTMETNLEELGFSINVRHNGALVAVSARVVDGIPTINVDVDDTNKTVIAEPQVSTAADVFAPSVEPAVEVVAEPKVSHLEKVEKKPVEKKADKKAKAEKKSEPKTEITAKVEEKPQNKEVAAPKTQEEAPIQPSDKKLKVAFSGKYGYLGDEKLDVELGPKVEVEGRAGGSRDGMVCRITTCDRKAHSIRLQICEMHRVAIDRGLLDKELFAEECTEEGCHNTYFPYRNVVRCPEHQMMFTKRRHS